MAPQLVMFDVDKTLARSKQPLAPEMAKALGKLIEKLKVAIVSGDSLAVIEKNVVTTLPPTAPREHLYLLPISGAALYEWKGEWRKIYEELIPPAEEAKIDAAIRAACHETGLIDFADQSFGERIEYRGGEVTLSALGQDAPIEPKEAWDRSGEKKRALRAAIAEKLPGYSVKVGGSTSIDITKPGIDKAYGVRKLSEHLLLPVKAMLYVGDELEAGGNDAVVKETGIVTHEVKGPEETEAFIRTLIS